MIKAEEKSFNEIVKMFKKYNFNLKKSKKLILSYHTLNELENFYKILNEKIIETDKILYDKNATENKDYLASLSNRLRIYRSDIYSEIIKQKRKTDKFNSKAMNGGGIYTDIIDFPKNTKNGGSFNIKGISL